MAIKAGIEARKIALAEQQGAMVARASQEIFGKLDLTKAQTEMVPTIVPAALRQLAHGQP